MKWRSTVAPLKKYSYPHLSEARRLKQFVLSEDGLKKYFETSYCMFTVPGNVIDLTGHVLYTLFGEGQQMEGDIMDFLINLWKDKPETSDIFSCADRVVLSPDFIQYCLEYDYLGALVPKFHVKKSATLLPMFVRKEEDLLNAKLVFLIPFKPIGKIVHYSLYVLNIYRGSIDILDSFPYSNKGLS